MPGTARAWVAGFVVMCSIVATGTPDVFHKDGDFAAFLQLLVDANGRLPMRILGYVLMHNHFHLVLWPRIDPQATRQIPRQHPEK